MTHFQIKSRWHGNVNYEGHYESIAACLLAAIDFEADLRGADLSDANLRGADLSDANLSGANLSGADLRRADLFEADLSRADLFEANLSGANLREADLFEADLRRANLREADLSGANLREADLRGANLREADLRGANLSGANLSGADLSDANLSNADLTPIRDDLWSVLCSSPREAFGLKSALLEGRVDGSTYCGACACLVGTLANERSCNYDAIPGLRPNASRPIERFFLAIMPGDTPDKSQFAALAIEWINQWHAMLDSNPFAGQQWTTESSQ